MSASVFCGCPSSDVTYLWAGNRWTCLAVLIDLFARKRTGWALSSSPDSEFTCKALWMAEDADNVISEMHALLEAAVHQNEHTLASTLEKWQQRELKQFIHRGQTT
ncbi:hypothetical protein CJJ18_02470 [Candidatus Williamhamiltonella defendens]|uniref:Integrase catalytic domain-containing protein n=1 Tax=Candidatus Williamhamiltonella defendens TaxID=138072 RepID=A0AAC9VJD1_9ENTR|nr:hypothetical protein CJJ18_02470 [Candidatus Hamiltonella defensa]AWK16099.1 hypothetical protein CCS40_02485 [Candidatus Hamiltonella defensa]